MTTANRDGMRKIQLEVHERVSAFLNNRKRRDITQTEEQYEVSINITSRTDVSPEHLIIKCFDEIGSEIKISPARRSKSKV
jgi:ribonuclease E